MNPPISLMGDYINYLTVLGAIPFSPETLLSTAITLIVGGGAVKIYEAWNKRKLARADEEHTDADTQKIKADTTSVLTGAMLNVIEQLEQNTERLEKRLRELEAENKGLAEWQRMNLPELARLRQYDKLSERSKGNAE